MLGRLKSGPAQPESQGSCGAELEGVWGLGKAGSRMKKMLDKLEKATGIDIDGDGRCTPCPPPRIPRARTGSRGVLCPAPGINDATFAHSVSPRLKARCHHLTSHGGA